MSSTSAARAAMSAQVEEAVRLQQDDQVGLQRLVQVGRARYRHAVGRPVGDERVEVADARPRPRGAGGPAGSAGDSRPSAMSGL